MIQNPADPPSRPCIAPQVLEELAREHGTPLYILNLDIVDQQWSKLSAFDSIRYAQKAHSGLHLLKWLAKKNAHVDAVSGTEVLKAIHAGFPVEHIELATDVLDRRSLKVIEEHEVRVNIGTLSMIPELASTPCRECTLRINPGFGGGHDQKVTTGGSASKHGIWWEELPQAYEMAAASNLTVTGLHMHIGSGVTLDLLEKQIGFMQDCLYDAPETVSRISTGGGLPIPYQPHETEFPVEQWSQAWLEARDRWQRDLNRPIHLEVEPGRFLVAQAGILLTEVRGTKSTPDHDWIMVDAGFHTLARPMLYGAYHEVVALRETSGKSWPQLIAGPLCESGDVLTTGPSGELQPRYLPRQETGDYLALLDVGAYGISMASGYNGFDLPAEVTIEEGQPRLTRARQTPQEQWIQELP